MNKLTFILAFFLIIQGISFSQDFKGGITGGLVGSQVAGDCCSGYHKAGLFLGGYVYYELNRSTDLQMELYYIQKGSRQTPDEDNNYQKYVLNLHYAELPVMVRVQLAEKIAADAGLAYAVYITKKEEWNFQDDVSGKPFNRHNLNFIAGIYYLVNDMFRIYLRSNNSITPIRPHVSGATRFFNQGQYSDAICIGVQYDL